MRLLVTLLFLLTPLQSMAALALCLGVKPDTAMACDPGMSEMSEGDEDSQGAMAATPSATQKLATLSSTDSMDGTGPCGAVGLCSAPMPGVMSTVARALPGRPTDTGPLASLPHLGPGIRPAPPLHPPRA
jgi:hypothetical protein